MDEKQVKSLEELNEIVVKGFVIFANDIDSHKKALDRLQTNQEAQHKKLQEFAELWNDNLSQIQKALASQAEMLRALQAVVLRNERVN